MIAYIGVGSNLGDRQRNLEGALSLVRSFSGIWILRTSRVYETEPWGYKDQPKFLNMVAEVETSLGPFDLLDGLLNIEQRLGRERRTRWGPRVIDLDILLYDSLTLNDEKLTIPHPRMWERGFVLVPLSELTPDLKNPTGESLKDIVRHPEINQGVALYGSLSGWSE
ncbi:MAG: 2-amino-4-hydroxy-6-hydroxymethyldihydropteridine diphosphokinase [Firmicutes bacterium]|nr:2-amino-4-hydroxy-6-hydroxymethyldihydropteridine diphosphokinase [Bacillota bacterium]